MIGNAQFVSIELDHFKFYYRVEQQCDKKHVGRVISMDSKYTVMKLNIFYRIESFRFVLCTIRSHGTTSKTKAGGLVRVALFWKSHCATCSPACVILYHVTGSCKGPGEQRWRNGESAHLPPMWPGCDSSQVPNVGCVCCWLSPCSEGFLRVLQCSFLTKTNITKFPFDQDRGAAWKPTKGDVTSSISIVICNHHVAPVIPGSLRKPWRQRQRQRHLAKCLMSRAIAVHVRNNFWYISLPSSAKQQREMNKFCVVQRTWNSTADFWIFFISILSLCPRFSFVITLTEINKLDDFRAPRK